MSDDKTQELLERAREAQEYWTGTLHDRIIQRDLDDKDYEALHYNVQRAEAEMAIQEDNNE